MKKAQSTVYLMVIVLHCAWSVAADRPNAVGPQATCGTRQQMGRFRWALAETCAHSAQKLHSKAPNILLIVSEDNGPELGCYGDPYARTPNLDRLASEGVLFENAFVPFSVCSPSRASFLTGLYPHQNGQIGLATHKFAMYTEATPNFASILKKHGYKTGMIGKLHINPKSAFPFDFRAIPGANFKRTKTVADYAAEAARFFAQSGDSSWFLSVNYPDAHLPFLRQAGGGPCSS